MPNLSKKRKAKRFYSASRETKVKETRTAGLEMRQIFPDFFNLENLVRFATLLYVLALMPLFVFSLEGSPKGVRPIPQEEAAPAEVLGEEVARLPIPEYPQWRVSYYNTSDFSGEVRVEKIMTRPVLDFDWGMASPHVAVAEDNFSVVWETRLAVENEGFYNFSATADEGVKVYVDNSKILHQELPTKDRANETVFLSRGKHTLEVRYFEKRGIASLKLFIE